MSNVAVLVVALLEGTSSRLSIPTCQFLTPNRNGSSIRKWRRDISQAEGFAFGGSQPFLNSVFWKALSAPSSAWCWPYGFAKRATNTMDSIFGCVVAGV